MRKLIVVILTILPMVFLAQQTSGYRTYQIDNVTIRFHTGPDSEEINNAKIIGQYTALLSEHLKYEKPIFLDFEHDYNNYSEETICYLSYGTDTYEVINYQILEYEPELDDSIYVTVAYSNTVESIENVEKDIHAVHGVNEDEKIVLRQFGFHFDLTESMSLVYYALNNRGQVQNLSRPDTLFRDSSKALYHLPSIPRKCIDSIISTSSNYLEQFLEKKIYRSEDTIDRRVLYCSYYLQYGKYMVFAGLHGEEAVLDTLDRIYSFTPIRPEGLFVFITPTEFSMYKLNPYRFPEITGKQIRKHEIPIDTDEFTLLPKIQWLGDDIYLINYYNEYKGRMRFLYLEKEDELVEDLEKYINSYRKK